MFKLTILYFILALGACVAPTNNTKITAEESENAERKYREDKLQEYNQNLNAENDYLQKEIDNFRIELINQFGSIEGMEKYIYDWDHRYQNTKYQHDFYIDIERTRIKKFSYFIDYKGQEPKEESFQSAIEGKTFDELYNYSLRVEEMILTPTNLPSLPFLIRIANEVLPEPLDPSETNGGIFYEQRVITYKNKGWEDDTWKDWHVAYETSLVFLKWVDDKLFYHSAVFIKDTDEDGVSDTLSIGYDVDAEEIYQRQY